jgi:beta-lactamase superfamily II metal-dependent hydrolase
MGNDQALKLHLLDVGSGQYGDALLCEFGNKTILIDGAHPENINETSGHPSIGTQLAAILNQTPNKLHVDLLVVTHAHSDHIGCLPALIGQGLSAEWALVADEKLGWGHTISQKQSVVIAENSVELLVAALREEPLRPDATQAQVLDLLNVVANLESNYVQMLNTLQDKIGDHLVRYVGLDDPRLNKLTAAFQDTGMQIFGPAGGQLQACAEHLKTRTDQYIDEWKQRFNYTRRPLNLDNVIESYLQVIQSESATVESSKNSLNAFVNLQSVVIQMNFADWKMLFTGDMQLADPGVTDQSIVNSVAAIREQISVAGPYDFIKLAHHGSKNGTNEDILAHGKASRAVIGICSGSTNDANHPDPLVLGLLQQDKLQWVRTDRNGQATITVTNGNVALEVVKPPVNDPQPN